MNFDPALLDALAMTFVEAAIRELDTQPELTSPCLLGHTGGTSSTDAGVLSAPPCNTLFRIADNHQGPGSEAADRPHLTDRSTIWILESTEIQDG